MSSLESWDLQWRTLFCAPREGQGRGDQQSISSCEKPQKSALLTHSAKARERRSQVEGHAATGGLKVVLLIKCPMSSLGPRGQGQRSPVPISKSHLV